MRSYSSKFGLCAVAAFGLALTATFTACGEESRGNGTEEPLEFLDQVASEDDLPNCTEKREDSLYTVKDSLSGFRCNEGKWVHYDIVADSEDELPSCSKTRDGFIAFVVEGKKVLNCAEGRWLEREVPSENSSASVFPDEEPGNGVEKVESSSQASIESSSGSVPSDNIAPASADIKTDGYYQTHCPSGHTCTYVSTKLLNPSITYGEYLDTRDFQVYRTVNIGSQTWMAQNLNYDYNVGSAESECYLSYADSCAKYGRMYTWSAAMDSAAVFTKEGENCGFYEKAFYNKCAASGDIRGVCPSGWHLPSEAEWRALFNSKEVDGHTKLLTASAWFDAGNGEDAFGFAVLPAGYGSSFGGYYNIGVATNFWTSTEEDAGNAYSVDFVRQLEDVNNHSKDGIYYVRCVREFHDDGTGSSVASSSSGSVVASSSSAVIPDPNRGSSSSIASSSGGSQSITYTTECPSGHACTYAPTEQLNLNITYGEILDTRDYQVYKTVTIGSQTWMAQNLNYNYNVETAKSWCGGGSGKTAGDCSVYGRLYTWSAAMDSVGIVNVDGAGVGCGCGKICSAAQSSSTKKVQGVCPSGWHLPSKAEWETLFKAIDATYTGTMNTIGAKLKTTGGWGSNDNGSDSFGFSALPAGYRSNDGFFYSPISASFWSSTEAESSSYAYDMYLQHDFENVFLLNIDISGSAVRCLKND